MASTCRAVPSSLAYVRASSRRFTLALALASFVAPTLVLAEPPKRVVSINVCTDQLAMLLADEGQLYSVSTLATDPRTSAMADEARAFHANRGQAEEIFLMKPDLVVAGAYTARAAVEMLRQFDIPVEVFTPATGVDDIPAKIRQMGTALGREQEAEALVEDFETRLGALRDKVSTRPRAALYFANGYTTGDQTLAGQILVAAGFANIAGEAGLSSGGSLPLEVLAMTDPDFVVTSEKYPGASRSEAILDHPVVQKLSQDIVAGSVTDRDWICGTPYVLRAIEELSDVRVHLESSLDQ